MTPEEERELLIEQVVSAWRPSGDEGVRAHPAWHDLDDSGRAEAARRAMQARRMEAALDPQGLTTTARFVMAKIRGG